MAILAGGLTAAHAAEASDAASVDEVIVTGSVLRSRAEINSRLESVAVVDTLSRDDIGALPDVTVADSLRRIVGVTTVYNDDIGQFASIRGLHPDFIPVTMDGLTLATTGDLGEGTRKSNLQVLPGEALSQVQAYKTMSPDMDAGALGGLINLVPVSAYDPGVAQLLATVSASYSSYMDVPDVNSWGNSKSSPWGGEANVMASRLFGSQDQFGVTVSGFWSRRPRTQTNWAVVNRTYYNNAMGTTNPEAGDWNGLTSPTNFTSHNYTNLFSKWGGTARFEYKPTDRLYASLFGFAYYSDEQETRNSNRVYGFDQPQDITETTGSLRAKSADTQWRYNTFERDQRGLQGKVVAAIGDRGELKAAGGWSYARFLSYRPFVSFIATPNRRVTYDLTDFQSPVLDDPGFYLDPANYKMTGTYQDWRHTIAETWEGRADYGFNNKRDDRGFGFAVGVNYRDMDLGRDITSINYKNGRGMAGYALEPLSAPGFFDQVLWIDADTFWKDPVLPSLEDGAASANASRRNDYQYREKVSAAYANLSYATDQLNLQGGLRLDHTSFDATMASVQDGVLQAAPAHKSNKDTHVLPYVTAVYSFTPSLRLKAAFSQTLGRPNPETIATVEEVDTTDFTITRGNPDIQPRRSANFDLGGEYYFNNNQGMVTLTAFYKEIKDDILEISSIETIDGQDWQITEPVNGDTTKYKGVEFSATNSSFGNIHPLLGNVGASINAMWVNSDIAYRYKGQRRVRHNVQFQAPNFGGNAAVWYAFGKGSEVRLAYNRTGRYIEELGAGPWQDIVDPPYDTVDLTVKWAVTPNWLVSLDGRNILDKDRLKTTGPDGGKYDRALLETGSSWFVRLTYRQ
ncbi:TonB-dependent receptor [Phenylobacterium koreense]|uniref:TonB-dependent receptor n=1 Tax=Phenylobacterium koreense TaxID=266125 RepID=A0ABV2EMY6_9CAUL